MIPIPRPLVTTALFLAGLSGVLGHHGHPYFGLCTLALSAALLLCAVPPDDGAYP